ncbi:nuclear transport factor 2 family protein, partial [Mycolicibacterium vanbaalenii]|uniref:nuclear transport factor 2 family protein n=1 Tax=Mycolicibacterium vanbaalenii TaxID=110539 RepID=UPI0021F320D3
WWRSYGNELWEFDDGGLMRRREASINDVAIDESDRRYFGPRPTTNAATTSPCTDHDSSESRGGMSKHYGSIAFTGDVRAV